MIESIFNLVWKIFNRIPNLKERIFRFYAWKIFEYAPLLKRLIYYFYDKFWFLELVINDQTVDFTQKLVSNYEIDLSRLEYIALTNVQKHEDWDEPPKIEKIDSTEIYNVLYQHFLQNRNWQEINGIKTILNVALRYPLQSNPLNDAELTRFLKDLDKLYSSSNQDFSSDQFKKIKIGIGRNGDYILGIQNGFNFVRNFFDFNRCMVKSISQ